MGNSKMSRRDAIGAGVIGMASIFGATEVALAEETQTIGVDLGSMSLDDLLGLRRDVDAEIVARLSSDVSAIYPGTYFTGKDIKAGSYILTCTSGDGGVSILEDEEALHKAMSENDMSGVIQMVNSVPVGDTVAVNVEDGNVLVCGLTGSMMEQTASWVPDQTE